MKQASAQNQSEMGLHALDYWQTIRNRYGIILLTFFLVFMTVAVVTAIQPKEYEGKVVIEVQREDQDTFFGKQTALDKALTSQNFLQTQFKIMVSKENLMEVVKKLGLTQSWKMSEEDAINRLRKMTDPDEEKGTDLINIRVYSPQASEAPALANAIAEAYQTRRRTIDFNRVNRAVEQLSDTRKKQESEVEKARRSMLTIAEQYNITDLDFRGLSERGGASPDTGAVARLQNFMTTATEQEKRNALVETQIKSIEGKTGEELISAAARFNLKDLKTEQLYPEFIKLQNDMAQAQKEGLGPNHPTMLGLTERFSRVREQLQEGIAAIKTSLKDELDVGKASLQRMQGLQATAEDKTNEQRTQFAEYQRAKDNYTLQQQMLLQMTEEQEKAKLAIMMPRTPVEMHEKAVQQATYARPNVTVRLIIGAVAGLLLGLLFAFFLEYLDTSVKTLDDVERYLGVPVLAVIPKDVGILHKQSGLSPDAEAYRILRTNIEFNRKSADANAITVVSGGAGEGKSTTLVNLAFICAQGGYNTLMIDGDLRRPKLHTFFDINNSVGLTNYLTTELQLEDVILQTPIDNLYFMPSGILPADAAGILNSRRMSELIADVKNRFDLVLIDSPPILGVSDASVLASEVDLTMIVIQHRKLPRSMLLRVKQAIENVGGNLLGVVLNNVDVRSDSQYQYYTSYYTYYSPTNTDPKVRVRSAGGEDKGGSSRSSKPAPAPAASDDDAY